MTTTRTKLIHLTTMLAACYTSKLAKHGRVHLVCNGGKLTLRKDKSAEWRIKGKLHAVWGWMRYDVFQSATGYQEAAAAVNVAEFLRRKVRQERLAIKN